MLGYLGEPSVITGVLIMQKLEGQSERREDRGRGWRDARPSAEEHGQPLEAGKGNEMGAFLEPPKQGSPANSLILA